VGRITVRTITAEAQYEGGGWPDTSREEAEEELSRMINEAAQGLGKPTIQSVKFNEWFPEDTRTFWEVMFGREEAPPYHVVRAEAVVSFEEEKES